MDEDPVEEFMAYFKQTSKPSDSYFRLLDQDYRNFCTINERQVKRRASKTAEKPSKKPKKHNEKLAFIFDIEDSFVYLDSFLVKSFDPPETLYRAAKRMDDLVTDVACSRFFYKDFKQFQQPVIDYFARWDDGMDLRGVDFSRDRLARREPRPEDPEFCRERAWRSRQMAINLKLPIDTVLSKDLAEAYSVLDSECKKLNSLAASIFALLYQRYNTSAHYMQKDL